MSYRRTPLVSGEFYHIFNRGVAKQPTFLNQYDYEQALLALSYYRFTKPPMKLSRFKELSIQQRNECLDKLQYTEKHIEIVSFVFMPNHFHFLLKQTAENGISVFLSKFTNSYTKYFNTKRTRVGPIFQGVFKSVHIESDEQLIHVSRYIHLNPVASFVIKDVDLFSYPWSSLPDYLRERSSLLNMEPVLENFSTKSNYENFVLDRIDYAKKLEQVQHLILEDY